MNDLMRGAAPPTGHGPQDHQQPAEVQREDTSRPWWLTSTGNGVRTALEIAGIDREQLGIRERGRIGWAPD